MIEQAQTDTSLRGSINSFVVLMLCVGFFLFMFSSVAMAAQASYCALVSQDMMSLEARPAFSVKSYGAKGDGVTDDTTAIQKAFDDVPSGGVLSFPRGTYLHSKSLFLKKEGTILLGKGGVLKATNPSDQAIVLKGNKSAIIGMTLQGVGSKRSSQPQTTKIKVTGNWNQVLNNEIDGGASAGIFVFGGKDFRIVSNVVHDTLADGIHMTYGARRGVVEHNRVYRTGDDPIAVVSYHKKASDKPGLSGQIIIQNNIVSDVNHGRGITVVGGEDVLIKKNKVSNIKKAAGILVAQEKSFKTGVVRNVQIIGNEIINIQLPSRQRYTGHAAIDLNSSGQHSVQNIRVANNTVNGARFAGVRVLGDICNVEIENNDLLHIGSKKPIQVIKSKCAPQKVWCTGNKVDGIIYAPSAKTCGHVDEAYKLPKITHNVWLTCK